MSDITSNDYIKLIITYLKDPYKIPKEKMDEETKELKIDIFSNTLFENLYHNLLYFYNLRGKVNNLSEIETYFFSEIVNILDVIKEERGTEIILKKNFIKVVFIYIVYSINISLNVNADLILDMFLGFGEIFEYINNEKIADELSKFESELIKTVYKLEEIYYMDSDIYLNIPKKNNNFQEIIMYLNDVEYELPIYFKGFIEYNKKRNGNKFLIMKVYNYFQKINIYTDDKNIALYKGYSFYGINTYKNISNINLDEFKNITTNRINNNDAKNILILITKFLEEKGFKDFSTKLSNENLYYSPNISKVLDIFDDTEKYYQELYNQLKYYFSIYKDPNSHEECQIFNNNYSKLLWLNFGKILLLTLSESELYNDNIKIIFYFFVNIFNPELESSTLEFREDTIPKLFSQSVNSTEIIDHPEIYKIIDKDYSQCYPKFIKENKFNQTYINIKNKKILKILEKKISKMPVSQQEEIKNIQKHNNILPFPLLQDYLSILKRNTNGNYFYVFNIYKFYKYCYFDLDDISLEKFIGNIKNDESTTHLIEVDEIKKILEDNDFIKLIQNIMKSSVMKDAYIRIFNYYSTNGEFDIEQESVTESDSTYQNNLINNKTIMDYYNEFCKQLNVLNYSKLFIIMNLPKSIKGFTFRFLKIVVNSEGVEFKTKEYPDEENIIILLKAYLIFLIIHELNHFMKRYLNKNNSFKVCKTPEIKEHKEGGEQLIKLLFGHILIENSLNIEQAKYILDINNWNKKSVFEFKKDFKNIKNNSENNNSIVFLTSEKHSICDHNKLSG